MKSAAHAVRRRHGAPRRRSSCKGDNLSASTFWHGKLMNQWARDWVKYTTDGQGTYAICGMEDTGTLQSLTFLARRTKSTSTACSSCAPPATTTCRAGPHAPPKSLAETKVGHYSAYLPRSIPPTASATSSSTRLSPTGPRTATICPPQPTDRSIIPNSGDRATGAAPRRLYRTPSRSPLPLLSSQIDTPFRGVES